MKKMLLLLMLGLVGALLAPVAPATAAAGWVYSTRLDRNNVTFRNGEFVQFTVIYDFRYRAGSYAQVRPRRAIVSYDMPGSRMTCNRFLRKYDGVKANFYFWRPFTGENYNPPGFEVPCDESTQNSVLQVFPLRDTKWLEFGPGNGEDRQPRWKVNITLMRNNNEDLFKAYTQRFRPQQ